MPIFEHLIDWIWLGWIGLDWIGLDWICSFIHFWGPRLTWIHSRKIGGHRAVSLAIAQLSFSG